MSLAILIPLYPSLCVLFSSLLIAYLYRRNIRRACCHFSTCLSRKYQIKGKKRGHYIRLSDRNEVELESGFEPDIALEIQSENEESQDEDQDTDYDDDDDEEEEEEFPKPRTTTRTNPSSPLSLYFNAQTTLIHPHLLSPPAPPTPGWERHLRRRIDEGRGLGAWKDRLAERTVRWLLSFSS